MNWLDLFSKKDKNTFAVSTDSANKNNFLNRLGKFILGKTQIDADALDELEEILISSDVGVSTSLKIIRRLEEKIATEKYIQSTEIKPFLLAEMLQILAVPGEVSSIKKPLHVVLIVGVNGVGKTTSVGKMAYFFRTFGHKVLLGAADTFRAGAVEQLKVWAERAQVNLLEKGMHTDPAAVVHEAVAMAKSQNFEVLLIDTAGRLHNKVGLMNELGKIHRVIQKQLPDAPHEVLLVLDASTGQNAIEQAKQFTDIVKVSGIVLSKMDGSAKGGVVLAIADQLKIPIRFIGTGEGIENLEVFDSKVFLNRFFAE